ncbi:MAG: D-alanine--D-alanine ligase [Planctomycetaceae bacterium]|nr:D-alanine--D-alanine ligase [Planctomycetaceae bacterium]
MTLPAGRTITVLMGGPDAEREVSLLSGDRVATALETFDDLQVVRRTIDAPDLDALRDLLTADVADVVFPVLHGPWGEGGPLQELLARIGIPFVGCDADAAALAMDKMRTKEKVRGLGIPTPPSSHVGIDGTIDLKTPFVVKPIDEGSSVGVRVITDENQASTVVSELRASHRRLMAESFVEGRELTIGIVGEEALPVIEILPSNGVYDYDAKYLRNDTRYEVSPPLPVGIETMLADWSQRIHRGIGGRDLSRIDWLLDTEPDGTPRPWFLEVNTMPGMTDHSLVPMAAAASGTSMPVLCRNLAAAAFSRG